MGDRKRQQNDLRADEDSYYHITLIAPDRIEKCYVQNGLSPSHSIVATCHVMERKR